MPGFVSVGDGAARCCRPGGPRRRPRSSACRRRRWRSRAGRRCRWPGSPSCTRTARSRTSRRRPGAGRARPVLVGDRGDARAGAVAGRRGQRDGAADRAARVRERDRRARCCRRSGWPWWRWRCCPRRRSRWRGRPRRRRRRPWCPSCTSRASCRRCRSASSCRPRRGAPRSATEITPLPASVAVALTVAVPVSGVAALTPVAGAVLSTRRELDGAGARVARGVERDGAQVVEAVGDAGGVPASRCTGAAVGAQIVGPGAGAGGRALEGDGDERAVRARGRRQRHGGAQRRAGVAQRDRDAVEGGRGAERLVAWSELATKVAWERPTPPEKAAAASSTARRSRRFIAGPPPLRCPPPATARRCS